MRAYATNSFAISYGEEKTFTTLEQIWNNGISPGAFSVSATQQVNFSQGNLQYQASTNTWRFAEDQYAFVGGTNDGEEYGNVYENGVKCSNNAISSSYSGWIDLFGWGTSGYNHGANCYQPWRRAGYYSIGDDCDEVYGDNYYLAYGSDYNLYDQTGQADWGYNAISNGGNQENLWYTLSQSEWNYVFNARNTNSGIRYAKACVNGVNGVVLLPDDWDASIYTLNDANGGNYGSNMISASDWLNVFEPVGAVFLPAAGKRYQDNVFNICINVVGSGVYGTYWSATHYFDVFDGGCEEIYINKNYAKSMSFGSRNRLYSFYDILFSGNSVRLVSPIQPKAYTIGVTNITETTASCGGRIVNSGVNPVTECGLCWGTEPNPTIDNNVFISNGGTTGVFTMELTNLVPNTKYYVQAFATNSMGTFYGNEVSFTCRNTPEGAVNGLFSVSSDSQVYFSQGNLQYQASTEAWRFAEHQWDYVGGYIYGENEYWESYYIHYGNVSGGNNSNISPTYNGWIDLFGWGTSGYNHGAVCYQPWSTSQTSSNYYAYGNSTYNLYDQTGQADWGYNPISNGGNIPNAWRTLTQPEWSYIFNTRATTSGIRYAKAQVNDVNGVILLPDDWSPTTYNLNNVNTSSASFSSNTITVSQWTTFENAGAVFLPAAGDRLGADDPENGGCVYNVGSRGFYWSSSRNNNS